MTNSGPLSFKALMYFVSVLIITQTNNYGHAHGDEVLKRVALLIDKHTRPVDICARWIGEECLLVMPNCTQKAALHRIEKLRSAITFEIFEHFDHPVTLSFGVTLWPTSSNFDTALHHADNALYTSQKTAVIR